jgi:hypothetical protein
MGTNNDFAEKINGQILFEIILLNSHKKPTIIVEGESDVKAFKTVINDNCTTYNVNRFDRYIAKTSERERETVSNRKRVIDLVGNSRNKVKFPDLIVGIIDADFYVDENEKKITNKNIFLTDTHDLETLIYQSEDFTKWMKNLICRESKKSQNKKSFNPPKIDDKEIESLKIQSLSCGKYLAVYRAVRQNKHIKFNEKFPPFKYFISIKNNEVFFDIEEFVKIITLESNEDKTVLKENIEKKIDEHNDKDEYWLWKICNGHDLTKIMIILLFKEYIKNINSHTRTLIYGKHSDEISGYFIENYNLKQFEKTRLYNSLKEWKSDIFRNPSPQSSPPTP